MIPLYKAMIRPILEYANPVWHPTLRKHINFIEGVQRRFTEKIIGCSSLNYEERLKELNLPSLEYSRVIGDLTEVYKILHHWYDRCTTQSLLTLSQEELTRRHEYKLTKKFTNTRLYQPFFTNRIINRWNKLPTEAVSASTPNTFKNHIDEHFKKLIYNTELTEEHMWLQSIYYSSEWKLKPNVHWENTVSDHLEGKRLLAYNASCCYVMLWASRSFKSVYDGMRATQTRPRFILSSERVGAGRDSSRTQNLVFTGRRSTNWAIPAILSYTH